MNHRERLTRHQLTMKQGEFEWDFIAGVDEYETWDEIVIGESRPAAHTFVVAAEDIVSFNRACGETDPRMLDPVDPIAHPIFATTVVFYSVGTGFGNWLRSPGARNPGQRIEFGGPFRAGETIETTVTHHDKWIRRGNHYMEELYEVRNQDGAFKVKWFGQLILPPTRAQLTAIANS